VLPLLPGEGGKPGKGGACRPSRHNQRGNCRMDGFATVAKVSDLAPGQMKWVVLDRERVLLANVDGTFYALSDACGHQRAPLSKGKLEGHVVECPLHFAQFDVRTGALLSGPVAADVPSYEVRVEADTVYVKPANKR
jgi:nitrite reductase/ring-hydroxylating ferredoxin subunit